MKFKKLKILTVCFLYLFLTPNQVCKAENLPHPMKICEIFSDPVLAKKIAKWLNKASVDKIVTQEELDSITKIRSSGISELKGMQYLNNLFDLTFEEGYICDLSPLASLYKLEILNLNYNRISDLEPLRNLSNLKRLTLRRNVISNLEPLGNLSKCELIVITGNKITKASQLQPLMHHLPRPQIETYRGEGRRKIFVTEIYNSELLFEWEQDGSLAKIGGIIWTNGGGYHIEVLPFENDESALNAEVEERNCCNVY